jgi:crotonobetainyl-CoA:carnitine CoA-transferase CaiB-like acyl-CoA transferase
MQAALDLQSESLCAWMNAPQRPASVSAFKNVAGWYYAAPYGVYATKDGHLALSLSPLKIIAEITDEAKLASYAEQDSWTKQDEISGLIAARLKLRTTAEWVARMEPLKIWHAPVQDYQAIMDDPQVKHMKSLVTVPGAGPTKAPVKLVNHAVLYDGQSAEVRLPPQPLGAQTEEILRDLGLSKAEITGLTKDGTVKVATP